MANLDKAANRLGPLALAIVSLAVIVGVGSIVLANFEEAAYLESTLQEETAQPSTPFPTNYTVSQTSNDADFERLIEDSETIIFEDSSAGTNTTLESGTDYNVYLESGNYELLNTTETEDYDGGTSDQFYVDYEYEYSGEPNAVLNTGINSLSTFADFFTVIVVIGVAAVLFIMLRVVRGAGRTVNA